MFVVMDMKFLPTCSSILHCNRTHTHTLAFCSFLFSYDEHRNPKHHEIKTRIQKQWEKSCGGELKWYDDDNDDDNQQTKPSQTRREK